MYNLVFDNGECWQGGEPDHSKWNEIPNKPIKKIEYKICNREVIFENYESYNHVVERIHTFDGREKIIKIYVMARKGLNVYMFIFDLFTLEIIAEIKEFGKEYYGTATSGWKKGIENGETRFYSK
jgi:hypothetical protein